MEFAIAQHMLQPKVAPYTMLGSGTLRFAPARTLQVIAILRNPR
jgi:hypothetical protein